MDIATIWDGNEFRQVDQAEAEKLAKEDKAQILSDGLVDGLSLKYRKEFTGYKTREMRAEAPPVKVALADEAKPSPEEVEANWAKYRKQTAQALGKPFNKTTKAEVLAYMNG